MDRIERRILRKCEKLSKEREMRCQLRDILNALDDHDNFLVSTEEYADYIVNSIGYFEQNTADFGIYAGSLKVDVDGLGD